MIRVIVFAVIGLVLGLGGGSGFAVMRARKTVAAAVDGEGKKESANAGDEKHGDDAKTTKADGDEHAASAAQDSANSVTHSEPRHDTATATPPAAPHTPTVAQSSATSASAPSTAKPPATDTSRSGAPAPGRIAKIFAAMSAKDAARVLQQLDDADVQTVLVGLNDKQAAAILSGFPPERAAAISRAVLRGKKGTS